MEFLTNLFWHDGKLFGIEWGVWKVVGWAGNLTFTSRFVVQWYATEKLKRVVVPVAFWWLSLIGSLLLLAFAIFSDKQSVFIFAYAFTWLPYIRNLMIHRRNERLAKICGACAQKNPPQSNFCPNCGGKLA